jgi:hypothetical protein
MPRLPLLCAAAALLAVGCVPVTAPLGDPDESEPDKKLLGKWTVTKTSGVLDQFYVASVEIDAPEVKKNPKGLMRATTDSQGPLWFYAASAGKHRYAVVCAGQPGEKQPQFDKKKAFAEWQKGKPVYWVFRYTLDGDALTLDIGDYNVVQRQFDAAGIASDGGKYFRVYSPTADWLAKLYAKDDVDKVYDGTNVLKLTRDKKK